MVQMLGDEDTALHQGDTETALERPLRLHHQRLKAVTEVIKASGARRVIDLGCGEGQLLEILAADPQFVEIVGMDISHRALEQAHRRLHLADQPPEDRPRIKLIHSSITYKDDQFNGFDAAAVVEVVEHLDPARLRTFERVVFEYARPKLVVITTPNAAYNVRFPGLTPGQFRHRDHRFEWTRAEFQNWARRIADTYGYQVHFEVIGPEDPEVGAPSQMGVFSR